MPADAQRLRVLAAGIFALVLTVGLARFAYTPLLPLMRSQAGLSDLAAGWLATLNYAGYMTGALLGASINNLRLKFLLYRGDLVVAVLAGHGGWVWVIVGAAATPSCFVWDHVAARLGHVRALLLAFALQTLSIALPATSGLVPLNLLGALLFGATFVGIVSLTLTLFGSHFPSNPGKAMSRMTLGYGVAQMAAPAMAGDIATVTGSYRGALLITAAVMCAGMGLLLAILREQAHPAR